MNCWKIISWNLLHRSGAMVDDIAALILLENPDLFLMQEATHSIDILTSMVGGHYVRQPWADRRHGLAIWSSSAMSQTRPLPLPASRIPGSFPTRMAQILQFDDITIANVHLSHGQLLNRRQLTTIAKSTSGPTAIIGDYNAFGPVFLRGFSDVGPHRITHLAQKILPFRLDRCMVRDLNCSETKVLQKGPSDHRPIRIDLFSV
jgi:endonuclease/exonuclease/phosphatase family metal-dependent hydrolase